MFSVKNLLRRSAIWYCGKKATMATEVEQNMEVHILPALQDNYMYILMDKNTKEAAAIDPFDAEKMLSTASTLGAKLTKILTTHHHWDHSGGNKAMLSKMSDLEVIGGDKRIEGLTRLVKHGDTISVGDIKVECLFTPCHTKGHICYFVKPTDPQSNPLVFTGDTLFFGGCGRFFEGTGQEMHKALVEILGNLPDNTKVFCGHEYTVNNLKFASAVEPENKSVQETLEWAQTLRAQDKFTIPSTIDLEKKTNPFMRVGEVSVQTYANSVGDPIKTMEVLRDKKNNFTC